MSSEKETVVGLEENGEAKLPVLLGGESMIVPVVGKLGGVDGYEVTITKESGKKVVFRVSKEQGNDLIEARIALLASEVSQKEIVGDEAFQSLIPSYVAEEYKKRLISLGIPENQIPQTTTEMVERATQELAAYRELGKEQIAAAAQHIADQILEIASEVLDGNKVRWNKLPKEFQNMIRFHLPSFSALAAQHSGISEETMEAQRRAMALNLMAQEETRNMILSHLPALAGAGADTIATFFGRLWGTTRATAESSYNDVKIAVQKKEVVLSGPSSGFLNRLVPQWRSSDYLF